MRDNETTTGATVTGSSAAHPAHAADIRRSLAVADLLRRVRYEVLSTPGTADEVELHVPRSVPVTVTSVAHRGLEPTLALSEDLSRRGYVVVPHLAARLVRDLGELGEIGDRLHDAGVGEVFVVAGDAEQSADHFADALDLLHAAQELPEWRSLTVGVAGYPEGHPGIPADALDRALAAKRPMSSYAVTQMCFDPQSVLAWVAHTRQIGFDRPVHAGVPGAVDALRLATVAARIGVGPSLRLARKQRSATTLLRPRGFRPDRLVEALAAGPEPPATAAGRPPRAPLAGLHVYTLGAVRETERWRRGALDRLAEVAGT